MAAAVPDVVCSSAVPTPFRLQTKLKQTFIVQNETGAGGIVVKLIVNLLLKAVTSPFSLLSGGGSGPDMSAIEFKPGTATSDS